MQWSIHTLNRNNPIPLYYQLAELVRERIRQGDLQPGERLPAEHELAALAGISRMTARQAIAYLVREGTLVVRHGAGTFVAEPKLTYNALHLLGFTAEIIRRGGTASSRVLEQTLLTPPRQVAAALELPTGSPVLKLVRLRLMDDLPLLLETSFLPAARYPALEHADLASQSLYALLEQHYQYRLERARETLEATIANEYESRLFGVSARNPDDPVGGRHFSRWRDTRRVLQSDLPWRPLQVRAGKPAQRAGRQCAGPACQPRARRVSNQRSGRTSVAA